jgi:2',3'-cyclic-nucleotide 2'-phosphodiesterase/3'-nucleotidase
MKYDAATPGNHDIETGENVIKRWRRQCNFPIVCGNMTNKRTDEPYFKPYTIIVKEGVRIAIIGLTTPAVPYWLPNNLWDGYYFENLVSAARKLVQLVREKEHPDLLVALVHSGADGGIVHGELHENAALEIARDVSGIDVIFFGHDHKRHCRVINNPRGESVLCLNPSSMAWCVADVTVELTFEQNKIVKKQIVGKLSEMNGLDDNNSDVAAFVNHFNYAFTAVQKYVSTPIGQCDTTVFEHDAYFGSSAFIDLVHTLQLRISGADISFAAPLSFDAILKEGTVYIRDAFNLYKFENLLCTIRLTGYEIKKFLEMSYALWTNQMRSPNDHIILLSGNQDNGTRLGISNFTYNFDSAAGIFYTVDVTKPKGSKINITTLANGQPFDLKKEYLVVTNSYRANGGGELLTKGAGIKQEELSKRLVACSELDLRHYLIESIQRSGIIQPRPLHYWHFIPTEYAQEACLRDKALLFRR